MEGVGKIVDYDDWDGWVKVVESIYNNPVSIVKMSKASRENYKNYSEPVAYGRFRNLVDKVMIDNKSNNIMLFCPWCDQGLGIQSRNYAKIVEEAGYNVSILSFKPYKGQTTIELQIDPEEWIIDNIYYSPNDREHVTDEEIVNFVNKYNVGRCILPETCWDRVFEIAKLLRRLDVKVYAVPNIEIVRSDELFKHTYFHKILCNNRLCMTRFNDYGFKNTEYIGYSFPEKFKDKIAGDGVKFVFIGGMNSISRKQIFKILDAFILAYEQRNNISLLCTIQSFGNREMLVKDRLDEYKDHPGITVEIGPKTYQEILNLYYGNHIAIQVSKQEGLGLGFYEALSTGTPVITLDTQPHNEMILDGVNGWTVECYHEPITENKFAIVEASHFEPEKLATKIVDIVDKFEGNYLEILESLKTDYVNRLSMDVFKKNLIESIRKN